MSGRLARGLAAVVACLAAVTVVARPAAAAPGPSDAPQYWFDRWGVPALWASGARGQGITIAEIDTGVARLPQLQGRVLEGTDFGAAGGDGRTDRDNDTFGHGTAMASIMVARPGPFGITGLAPGAKILPIAVPLQDTTEAGQPDHLADAIRYAVRHGAKIVNMSLGGKRTQLGDAVACSDDEQDAVYYALSKGVVLTASVGNLGPSRNDVEDPAVCLGVVAVGAVDSDNRVASFSTRQPFVTLTAPGVAVASLGRLDGQAFSGEGTSQATAITSAALALVWSKFPTLTGPQVVARVLATLDDRRSSPSSSYGYGVLDAGKAIRAAVPRSAANPVSALAAPFVRRWVATSTSSTTPTAPPARTRSGGLGVYAVGSSPRITGQVLLGGGLGGAGVVVLLIVLAVALIRRRRAVGAPAVDHTPVPWQYPPSAQFPPPADDGRPRPRPFPEMNAQHADERDQPPAAH